LISRGFFSINTLNTSSHSLLSCIISAVKSAHSLIELPLYKMNCFSLDASKILFTFR
jgi:hypothetical protein